VSGQTKPRLRGGGGRAETVSALHAIRCLYLPAAQTRIETVCRFGGTFPIRVGCDPVFGRSAKAIAAPRSVQLKERLKLVQLRNTWPPA
jgi:hypothetical protein